MRASSDWSRRRLVAETAMHPLGVGGATDAPVTPGHGHDAHSAVRGGVSLLVAQTAVRVIALLFVLIVTRALAPADFGRYSIATATVLFGGILADLGTTTAITRAVSANPSTREEASGREACPRWASASSHGRRAWHSPWWRATRWSPSSTSQSRGRSAADLRLTSVLGALDGIGAIAWRSAITATLTTVSLVAGASLVLAGLGPRPLIASTLAGPVVASLAAVVVCRRLGLFRRGSE